MKLQAFLLMLLPGLFLGCGGSTPSGEGAPELVIGADAEEAPVASLYEMPTPNELFGLIREMAGTGQKRLLNPVSNADRYASLRSRAVNFGIYSTDLVFASYFKLNVEVARYYLTTKKLADGIGIAGAFTDSDFVRLEANLTRGDSLEMISNEAYAKAYAELQDERMGPTLAMVLAGGWVETMYLLHQQIESTGREPKLMQRVSEQKVTLEHVMNIMKMHAADPDVAGVMAELVGVLDIYDQLDVKRVAHQGASSSGRMVLGDDVQMDLTDEKYLALSAAVNSLRSRMVAPEDGTNS